MTDEDKPFEFGVRCPDCQKEYVVVEGEPMFVCDVCGADPKEAHWEIIAEDVEIRINWLSLRVLCMWAELYAQGVDRAAADDGHKMELQRRVSQIAGRIGAQHPELAIETPLTLSGEIALLREEYPDVIIEGFNEDKDANDSER